MNQTDYRYYILNKKETARFTAVAGAAVFLAALLFYHSIIISAAAILLTVPLRKYYAAQLAEKRRTKLQAPVRDLLTSRSASFATGRRMTEALTEARGSLAAIYKEDEPISIELREITTRLNEGREREVAVLGDFARRSASADIAGFFDVYFTCLTTGGNLISAVAKASAQISDRIEMRRAMQAKCAQKKYETMLLLALPAAILLFMHISSPDYMAPLYGNPTGITIMTACLAVMAASYVWSRRIVDVKF
jgi:tight adherence protein B